MSIFDVIRYLIINNPKRFIEFLEDFYDVAWDIGCFSGGNNLSDMQKNCEIENISEWIQKDAQQSGFFYDEELKSWLPEIIEKKELPKGLHAYRNEDGTYCVEIYDATGFIKTSKEQEIKRISESKITIPRASIHITAYKSTIMGDTFELEVE